MEPLSPYEAFSQLMGLITLLALNAYDFSRIVGKSIETDPESNYQYITLVSIVILSYRSYVWNFMIKICALCLYCKVCWAVAASQQIHIHLKQIKAKAYFSRRVCHLGMYYIYYSTTTISTKAIFSHHST